MLVWYKLKYLESNSTDSSGYLLPTKSCDMYDFMNYNFVWKSVNIFSFADFFQIQNYNHKNSCGFIYKIKNKMLNYSLCPSNYFKC